MRNFIDTTTPISFRKTNDGYLVGDALCARTGVQVYARSELGLEGVGTVNVYRPPEAVFAKDSLETFAGKPVTLGHPSEPVSASNWKDLAVGQIGEEVVRDGEGVRVQIALMDAKVIQAIEGGTREISMGYTSPIEMRDGVAPDGTAYQAVQTGPIRINHLAIVKDARGGSDLSVNWGDRNWGAIPVIDRKAQTPMNKIIVDGFTIEVNDQGREAIEKLQKQVKDAQDQVALKDAELAKKDTELAQKDSALEAAKNAVPTGAVLDAMVQERAKLIDAARNVDPDMKLDGLSNTQVKQAVVKKVLGDAAVASKLEGKSEAYVDAYYDANFDLVLDKQTEDKVSTERLADGLQRSASLQDARAAKGSEKDEEEAFKKTTDRFNRKK